MAFPASLAIASSRRSILPSGHTELASVVKCESANPLPAFPCMSELQDHLLKR